MKIKYAITKDDYLKFNLYHMENSPNVKKELMIHKIVVPMMLIILGTALSVLWKVSLVIMLPISIVAAVLWSIYYPGFYKRHAMKNVEKVLNSGIHSESVSRYSITTQEEGIFVSCQAGQTLHRWDEIIKVGETDEYIFIYITQKLAHAIPKRAFETKGDEQEFMDTIRRKKVA